MKFAFSDRRIFYLPHTLGHEAKLSPLQKLRFHRSQVRNLWAHYGTCDLATACRHIEAWALDGDLITGGHIDFPSVRANIGRRAKMITLFRDPATRCRSEYDYCRRTYLTKPLLWRFDSSPKHKIASRYSFEGYIDFLLEHTGTYGNLAARYIGWDGKESLHGFFADHVFHSGVMEESGAFARGLGRKMGVPIHFPHDNRGKSAAMRIGIGERAKIARLYPQDFELYEWQLARIRPEHAPASVPANLRISAQIAQGARFRQSMGGITASAGR